MNGKSKAKRIRGVYCVSLGAAALFVSSLTLAVLPPKYARLRRKRIYAQARRLQKKAPEYLVVKILKVEITPRYHVRKSGKNIRKQISGFTYKVDAKILKVNRTRTRLRAGRRIRFTYQNRRRICPGPRIYNPNIVKKGQRVELYLQYNKKLSQKVGRYELAASVLSLVPTN